MTKEENSSSYSDDSSPNNKNWSSGYRKYSRITP
jgi:hypothetical protein